jgi:tRNA (adenine57-N1/adenine58-N1)-methyltransferase
LQRSCDLRTLRAEMAYGPLRDGEPVFLVDARGRRYLKVLRAGHRITIRGTVLAGDDMIGGPEGARVGEPTRERFLVFRPNHYDLVSQLARPAEPIFTKDVGSIVMRGGIAAGDRVIEAGVGSGMLTIALLRILGPEGRLTSYERRKDFAKTATDNVAQYYGHAPNWSIRIRDVSEGFEERDVDRIVTDLPEPVNLLDRFADSLRPGGVLICYVPTVLQFRDLREGLQAHSGFALAETFELLERDWHVEEPSVRPAHRMVAHTGFLTFARRTAEN